MRNLDLPNTILDVYTKRSLFDARYEYYPTMHTWVRCIVHETIRYARKIRSDPQNNMVVIMHEPMRIATPTQTTATAQDRPHLRQNLVSLFPETPPSSLPATRQ